MLSHVFLCCYSCPILWMTDMLQQLGAVINTQRKCSRAGKRGIDFSFFFQKPWLPSFGCSFRAWIYTSQPAIQCIYISPSVRVGDWQTLMLIHHLRIWIGSFILDPFIHSHHPEVDWQHLTKCWVPSRPQLSLGVDDSVFLFFLTLFSIVF